MLTELTATDGHKFDCWIEPATGKAKGGLVIIQEIFGLTEQLKGVARKYAEQGYNVAIPALFDRVEKGSVVAFDDFQRALALTGELEMGQTLADIDAAVGHFQKDGLKVGVMGFCWGGGIALRAAQKLEIGCGISFYGTRMDQYLDCPLNAPFQAHFAEHDTHAPMDVVEKVRDYYPHLKANFYDAGHAFANEERPAVYNAAAAEEAHARSAVFLAACLG
jgi:carboxymethylenebutenolidase